MANSSSASIRLLLKLFTNINKLMVFAASATLTATAVMLTCDVSRRYLFNAPLPASVEISSLLQAYVIFLPLAYTLAKNQHVRVTVLTGILSQKLQKWLLFMAYMVMGIVAGTLAWHGWHEFVVSYSVNEIMMAPIIVYWWIGKFSAPFGLLILSLQAFLLAAALLMPSNQKVK